MEPPLDSPVTKHVTKRYSFSTVFLCWKLDKQKKLTQSRSNAAHYCLHFRGVHLGPASQPASPVIPPRAQGPHPYENCVMRQG